MKNSFNILVNKHPDVFIKGIGLLLFLFSLPYLAFNSSMSGGVGEWLQFIFHFLILINLIPFVQYKPTRSWMINTIFLTYILIWGFYRIAQQLDLYVFLNNPVYGGSSYYDPFSTIAYDLLGLVVVSLFLNILFQPILLRIYNITIKQIYLCGLITVIFSGGIYLSIHLTNYFI